MIHELRIYHCVPGRLPVLLNRFETITLAIWERFGIRQIGFWTVEIGDSNADLYYCLSGLLWPSGRRSGRRSCPILNGFRSEPRPRRTGRFSRTSRT
jgi:NIPSNAP protein